MARLSRGILIPQLAESKKTLGDRWIRAWPLAGVGRVAGELEGDPRAPARRLIGPDPSFVRFHDRSRDRQSQARAAARTLARGLDPVEAHEDPVALQRRDPGAVIGNGDLK